MLDIMLQYITESELVYLARVAFGGLLGLCIGIERSRRQKEAGMATHFIVACAATLLTCISLWFKKDAGDLGDGSRVAAQIVLQFFRLRFYAVFSVCRLI